MLDYNHIYSYVYHYQNPVEVGLLMMLKTEDGKKFGQDLNDKIYDMDMWTNNKDKIKEGIAWNDYIDIPIGFLDDIIADADKFIQSKLS